MKNFTLTAFKNTTLASDIFSFGKRRTMFFALLVIAFCSNSVFAQVAPIVINNGSSISDVQYKENGVTPFAKGRNKSRVQYLYEDAQLSQLNDKMVTRVGFNVTNLNPGVEGVVALRNVFVKIYLVSNTTAASYKGAGASVIDIPGNPTPNIEVSIPVLAITQTGWVDLDLGAGFYKSTSNNEKNLIIEICSDNTGNVATENFSVQMVKIGSGNSQKIARGRFNIDNTITALPSQAACALPGINGSVATANNYSIVGDRTRRPVIRFTVGCNPNSVGGDAHIADEGVGCPGSSVKLDVVDGDVATGFTYQWKVSDFASGPFTAIAGAAATNATLIVAREVTEKHYLREQRCFVDPSEVRLSNSIKVDGGTQNVYSGGSWSLGEPTSSSNESIYIQDGSYTMSADKKACSCSVNTGATLIVNGGNTLVLTGPVRNGGGTIKMMHNSSILQDDNIVNTGKVDYYRNSQPMVQYDYTYWGSPVADATVGSFAVGTEGTHIYSWNHLTQAWVAHIGTDVMQPGIGYIVRAPEPATPAQASIPAVFNGLFRGIPSNGLITSPVKQNAWSLVGNPYPSAVDADLFIQDPLNEYYFDGTVYFWTHNSGPSSAYAGNGTVSNYNNDDYTAYNLLGGFPAPSNPSQGSPSQYIGAGQSFMIKALEYSGAVSFTNDMRIGGTNNSQFYRASNTATQTTTSIEKHRVWLQIANATNFKQTLVGYATGATNGKDRGFDGEPMDGNALTFYSLIGAEKFTIQGRALPFEVSDIVPLGYKTNIAGTHTISMYLFDGLFTTTDVFLEDTVTGVMHNLKQGNYTFSTTAGTFNNRFKLKYANSSLGNDDVVANSNEVIVYKNGTTLNIASQSSTLKEVKIFDLSGRLLATRSNIGNNNIAFENTNWSNQVIIVQSTTDENIVTTKKVVF